MFTRQQCLLVQQIQTTTVGDTNMKQNDTSPTDDDNTQAIKMLLALFCVNTSDTERDGETSE